MTRAVAGIVVNLPTPAISDGHPSVPLHWAGHGAEGEALGNGGHSDATWTGGIAGAATLIQGPLHIHSIPDPNPIWDPRTSGWTFPPGGSGGNWPPGWAGDMRWTVDTLPDPKGYPNGWYWLGEATGKDDTANIEAGARQWNSVPDASGPAWHSFFPFKPSVNGYDAPIIGENKVHHAKGVHCNSHYIEHMWLDFGGNWTQPFTWIVVATVMSDPFPGYRHTILDSGRNPDDVGFPRSSASSCNNERRIGDDLSYRTGFAASGDTAEMFTLSGEAPLRIRGAPGHHPRMYASIYDGEKSRVAAFDPFGKYQAVGSVTRSPSQSHRFTVFGREQGWMSQGHASNIMIFEMRYWRKALTDKDLDEQYAQLSSTHQFDAYKHL